MTLAGRLAAIAVLAGTLSLLAVSPALAANVYATSTDQAVSTQIDSAHDGNLAHDTLTPPLSLAWRASLNYPSYPVVDNGKVFVTYKDATTQRPLLVALTMATGAIAWGPIDAGGQQFAYLGLEGGRLFLLNGAGQLVALDENTGSILWYVQLSGQQGYTLPVANSGIIYSSGYGNGGTLYANRESDGASLWTVPFVAGIGVPTVSSTGVYVSAACGQAFDVNPATGSLIWQSPPSCSGASTGPPVLADGRLFVRGAGGNVMLDAATGASYGPYTSVVAPAVRGARVFYRDPYALNAADLPNTMAWLFAGDGSLSSAPIVVNGVVYIGSSKGNVYGVDAATGAQVWTASIPDIVPDGNGISGLAAGYGMLFVPGAQGLYAFGGQETLYPGDATWTGVPVGQSTTPAAPFTLTNNLVTAGLTPTIAISGDFSQSNNCPATLSIGASCLITVTFTPTTAGQRKGNLTITDNAAGSPHAIALVGNPGQPGPLDHLTVTPAAATIQAGASQTYAVEAFDQNNNDLGTVTASSTLAIAPDGSCTGSACTATVAGSHTVTATYSGKSGTAPLTVTVASPSRLMLSPASATIIAGGSQAYGAAAFDQYGNNLGDVTGTTTFQFNDGSPCSANVCSTTKAFPWTIQAFWTNTSGSAQLTVKPGPADHLALDPAVATIQLGGGLSYNAEGFDRYGNDLGNLASSSTFAIAPDGSCLGIGCSPARAGVHTVTATNGGASGTATLTATAGPPDHLALTPAIATIAAGGSASFSAEAFDTFNNDLGDVTASTIFSLDSATGPACSGNVCSTIVAPGHQVVASYQGLVGYANLNVTPGPLDHLTIWPTNTSMQAGSSVQFRTFGYDRYGNTLGEVTNGTTFTINPDGTCTLNACGSKMAGPHTITATDGSVSASTGFTVTAAGAATLALTPATASMTAGQSQMYRAEAFDPYGNDAGDYTTAATFGMTPDGTCTGSSCSATSAGSHAVTAIFGNASGTAALAVGAGPLAGLRIAPTSLSLAVTQSASMTVRGADAYGNVVPVAAGSVAWSVSKGTPGSVSPTSGLATTFQANSTSASGSVIAKSGTLTATASVTVLPAAPKALTATAGTHKVNLKWDSATADKTYRVYRQDATGTFTMIASGLTATSFADSNVITGVTYQYYVTAVSVAGIEGSPSSTVSAAAR